MCPAFLPEEGRSSLGDLAARLRGKWSHSVGILLRKKVFMFEDLAAGFFGYMSIKQTDKTRKSQTLQLKCPQQNQLFLSTPPHRPESEYMISHIHQPHPDCGRPAQHCHLVEELTAAAQRIDVKSFYDENFRTGLFSSGIQERVL